MMTDGFARQSGGQVRSCSEPGQGTARCIPDALARKIGETMARG